MATFETSRERGFSPPISASLLIHGERFKIGSMGPAELILQDARPMLPGRATIHFKLDGKLSIYDIEMTDGIDPARDVQPYLMIRANEEAVA